MELVELARTAQSTVLCAYVRSVCRNEPAMWRKLPARVHADAGVEHELFICAGSLRGVICGAKTRDHSSRQRETSTTLILGGPVHE